MALGERWRRTVATRWWGPATTPGRRISRPAPGPCTRLSALTAPGSRCRPCGRRTPGLAIALATRWRYAAGGPSWGRTWRMGRRTASPTRGPRTFLSGRRVASGGTCRPFGPRMLAPSPVSVGRSRSTGTGRLSGPRPTARRVSCRAPALRMCSSEGRTGPGRRRSDYRPATPMRATALGVGWPSAGGGCSSGPRARPGPPTISRMPGPPTCLSGPETGRGGRRNSCVPPAPMPVTSLDARWQWMETVRLWASLGTRGRRTGRVGPGRCTSSTGRRPAGPAPRRRFCGRLSPSAGMSLATRWRCRAPACWPGPSTTTAPATAGRTPGRSTSTNGRSAAGSPPTRRPFAPPTPGKGICSATGWP